MAVIALAPEQIDVLNKTVEFVRGKHAGDGSGHDWWHIYRVWQNARMIAECEDVDRFVVELSALLHDIADWKFHDGDATAGPRAAREWLETLPVDTAVTDHVCEIIESLSFKGAGVKSQMRTREGMVTQDADRLDSLGAIGIARTFAYGGHTGRLIHDPEHKPERHETFEQYKSSKGPSVNHFYEKILLLKDLLNTETAKKIGEKRHQFVQLYLQQFLDEWDQKA